MSEIANPKSLTTEPFAYFQRNEGWDTWEQVAHEHRHEEGVVPAYRSPPIDYDEAFARGVEAAVRVAETVSTIGPTNQMWENGSQYTRTRIAAAIRDLATPATSS